MSIRTRSRGNQNYSTFIGTVTRIRHSDGLRSPHTTAQVSDVVELPYEQMTDVKDLPRASHNVSHLSRTSTVPGAVIIGLKTVPSWFTSSDVTTFEWAVRNPLRGQLALRDTHLGVDSGIRALAIARVPAYDRATLEGFVSLIEAREIVDSLAWKSAIALGRYAFLLSKAAAAKKLKAVLSREAKRALDSLRRSKPKDAKQLFQAVLSGIQSLNGLDLEWKFGVAPMIRDLQAATSLVEKLASLQARAIAGKRVYGKAIDERVDSGIVQLDGTFATHMTCPGPWRTLYTKTTRTVAIASVVRKLNPAHAMYDVDWFTGLDAVMEISGLNPSAKKVWNLFPLSFITDWFWNASELLESLETLSSPIGSSFVSFDSLYSVKTETTVKGSGYFVNSDVPTTYEGSVTRRSYTRNSDPLEGGPVLYIPPLTLPTKAGQWFSMAQIAFQRFR